MKTVSNITVEYYESTHSIGDLLDVIAERSEDLVVKSVAKTMDADKISIGSNSQGHYEGRSSDHSVTRIDNLAEIVPLIIEHNDYLISVWNNGIDQNGDNFTSPYIEDLYNCFPDGGLRDAVEATIDSVADSIIDDLIELVRRCDESDYQDAHNFQAFATWMSINNIEDNGENFYDYEYVNSSTDVKGYTQITDDQYEDLYVKLPSLVEHKR